MKTENTENTSDTKKTSMSEAANCRYWERKAQEATAEEA